MNQQDSILKLYSEVGRDFYLFDLDEFRANIREFTDAFTRRYDNFRLAYSYKTNYTPALCSAAHHEGALAEVVSVFEYELAIANRVAPKDIIINGPVHDLAFIRRALDEGAQLNVDGFAMLDQVVGVCGENPEINYRIGLRFNFQVKDGPLSRFGFYNTTGSVERIKSVIHAVENLRVNALHCHFSTALRSTESFGSRSRGLVQLYREHFSDQPVEQINIGGGFFSKMPQSLQDQFGVTIPTYADYAEAVTSEVGILSSQDHIPRIVIEPGTAVVANIGRFVCSVLDIKSVTDHNFALVGGSVHNIKPTMNAKNLPFSVINTGAEEPHEARYDLVGYTCMETDYLCRDVPAEIAIGDLIVFENVGGYTNVFKPPFIRLQAPIYGIENGQARLIKRPEVTEDVTRTYVYA